MAKAKAYWRAKAIEETRRQLSGLTAQGKRTVIFQEIEDWGDRDLTLLRLRCAEISRNRKKVNELAGIEPGDSLVVIARRIPSF